MPRVLCICLFAVGLCGVPTTKVLANDKDALKILRVDSFPTLHFPLAQIKPVVNGRCFVVEIENSGKKPLEADLIVRFKVRGENQDRAYTITEPVMPGAKDVRLFTLKKGADDTWTEHTPVQVLIDSATEAKWTAKKLAAAKALQELRSNLRIVNHEPVVELGVQLGDKFTIQNRNKEDVDGIRLLIVGYDQKKVPYQVSHYHINKVGAGKSLKVNFQTTQFENADCLMVEYFGGRVDLTTRCAATRWYVLDTGRSPPKAKKLGLDD